ncbi:MAG TPA: choice-of-anchor Q domain-containing protein, partial [Rhodanobacteraceae bacterium]|nr:choice-of-anchor Q domain-containing protein [Rhodanobacteraceae bacterium]
EALSDTTYARGGGIHVLGTLILTRSNVSGNQALAPASSGSGGGIQANNLISYYSSISENVAGDSPSRGGIGGGAYALEGIAIYGSTIDNNTASYGGALMFREATTIVDSTISGNTAHKFVSALDSVSTNVSLSISNSTIAFNHAETNSPYGAVAFASSSASSTLSLQSSIIADNTAGAMNTPSDLSMLQGVLAGANSLVMASSVSDPNVITVTADPKLGPLQFNGGPTRTHALLPGSPALGAGNDNLISHGITTDQRGLGYPRTTGKGGNVTTDIGAFEFDSIFSGRFDSN